MTSERILKAALCRRLRTLPGVVVFRHEDRFTGGIPDISVSRDWKTVWIEVKFDRGCVTRLQDVVLERLRGFLVTYRENRTYVIVYGTARNYVYDGYDHDSVAGRVAEFLRR